MWFEISLSSLSHVAFSSVQRRIELDNDAFVNYFATVQRDFYLCIPSIQDIVGEKTFYPWVYCPKRFTKLGWRPDVPDVLKQ